MKIEQLMILIENPNPFMTLLSEIEGHAGATDAGS